MLYTRTSANNVVSAPIKPTTMAQNQKTTQQKTKREKRGPKNSHDQKNHLVLVCRSGPPLLDNKKSTFGSDIPIQQKKIGTLHILCVCGVQQKVGYLFGNEQRPPWHIIELRLQTVRQFSIKTLTTP